ncbi:MAG: AMIN domain-containing protein, partial [Gammaproteobacteria bacterium]|nr:AMIN domain-containing protein [Gammaproteobacteria bacterium]
MKRNSTALPRALFAAALGLVWGTSISTAVVAGEIESLAWQNEKGSVLQIRVKGEASYSTESLEGGQRLRVRFTDSTLGPSASELERRNHVKGVYPYLADNGANVNVDLLLTDPGRIDVEKTNYGYRVVAVAGAEPAAVASTAVEPAPTPAVPAAAASGTVIEDIRYAILPGSRVQVTLHMSGPPPKPTTFSITNPARIALDFPNTRVGLTKKTVRVKEGAVLNVTAIEAADRTRVVLSLVRPVAYTTAVEGNTLAITLDTPVQPIAPAQEPTTKPFSVAAKSGKFNLDQIDFHRGPQGEAQVTVTLSNPAIGIDINEQAGQIILDFLDTSIPPQLQRRLDVVDFATPVQTIDAFPVGQNARMVITPKGRYEHAAYQAGNIFAVSIKPILEKEEERAVDEFGYSGEKLSLNFQKIDVRAALQVLADFTGLNFVVSDS